MTTNHKPYDYQASFNRIDAYLGSSDNAFEERDSLPLPGDDLTFENGYYAYCTALFIDIRDSSKLPDAYSRPVLAKIYRAFISEMVAVLNSDLYVREVSIVGDCVWGVYNTPLQQHLDDVFHLAYQANSVMKVLRAKMQHRGYKTPISAGIGMAYGRALMIKAGHMGSGINDVVYMGDVVNRAAHLASQGARGVRDPIMVDNTAYNNLNQHNQGLLYPNRMLGCYSGDVWHTGMEEWRMQNYP